MCQPAPFASPPVALSACPVSVSKSSYVVRPDDTFVVIGREGYFIHLFCGEIVLATSNDILRPQHFSWEQDVFAIIERNFVFLWHLDALTIFFFFTIKFLDCVELRLQANKLWLFHHQPHPWTFLEPSCWFLLECLKDGLVRNLKCQIFLGRQLKYLRKNLLFRFHSKDCQCLWTTNSPWSRIFSWCIYNENHTSRSLTNRGLTSQDKLACWKPIPSSCALRQDLRRIQCNDQSLVLPHIFSATFGYWPTGYSPGCEYSRSSFQRRCCSWVWKNLSQTRVAPWNEGSYSSQCMVSTMLFRQRRFRGESSLVSNRDPNIVSNFCDEEHISSFHSNLFWIIHLECQFNMKVRFT